MDSFHHQEKQSQREKLVKSPNVNVKTDMLAYVNYNLLVVPIHFM